MKKQSFPLEFSPICSIKKYRNPMVWSSFQVLSVDILTSVPDGMGRKEKGGEER